MNRIEENSLRDFGRDSEILEKLKDIKLSENSRSNIWNSIKSEIESKNNKNIFKNIIMYKPYFAIAAVVIFSFTAILFYKDGNSIPKNIINIKMGGTITPAKDTLFSLIKSTHKEEYVTLESGELDIFVIPTKKGESEKHFELETKDGFVVVKGTKFKVNVDRDGTTVSVTKGTVWVTPKGEGREKIILTAGKTTHILPLSTFLRENKENGIKAYINKDYSIAKKMLEIYLLNQKDDFNIITILARVAEYEKRYDDAIKYYNRVLKGGSSIEKETAFVAIAVLLKNSNQKKRAEKMFLNYLKEYPKGIFKDDVRKELNKK